MKYRDRNMGGRPPRYFYSVPCPLCKVPSGVPCRSQGDEWVPPHLGRVQRRFRIEEYEE